MSNKLVKKEIYQRLVNINFFQKGFENNKTAMGIFIILTGDCNLQCKYCFEDNMESTLFSSNLCQKLISYIEIRAKEFDFESLDITFTGGEPFLCEDIIDNVLFQINQRFAKQFSINYFMISNGTIYNKEIYDVMDKFHFHLQVTLDGLSDEHNQIRTNAKGVKTFSKICNNIDTCLADYKNIEVNIRINIGSKKKETYLRLIDYIKERWEEFLKIGRLKFYFSFLDVAESSPYYYCDENKLDIMEQILCHEVENNLELPIGIYSVGKCMLRDPYSVAIDGKGDLYKCFSFLNVQELKVGNLNNSQSLRSLNKFQIYCPKSNCSFFNGCMGGCVYHTYALNGKIEINCPKKYLIEANKVLFSCELMRKKIREELSFEEIKKNVSFVEISIA